ncbi:hypothetical protein ACLOJK_027419 [Asimina triloba]
MAHVVAGLCWPCAVVSDVLGGGVAAMCGGACWNGFSVSHLRWCQMLPSVRGWVDLDNVMGRAGGSSAGSTAEWVDGMRSRAGLWLMLAKICGSDWADFWAVLDLYGRDRGGDCYRSRFVRLPSTVVGGGGGSSNAGSTVELLQAMVDGTWASGYRCWVVGSVDGGGADAGSSSAMEIMADLSAMGRWRRRGAVLIVSERLRSSEIAAGGGVGVLGEDDGRRPEAAGLGKMMMEHHTGAPCSGGTL